jgi:hypothetical protein
MKLLIMLGTFVNLPLGQPEVDNMPRSIYEFSLRSVWQLANCWQVGTVPVRSFILQSHH